MKSGVIVVCASKDTMRLKKYVFLNHHKQFTSRLVSIFTVCLYRMIRLLHEMHCPIDGWEEKDLTDGWEQKLFFFFSPQPSIWYCISSSSHVEDSIISSKFFFFFDLNHIIKLDQSITINGPQSLPLSYIIKKYIYILRLIFGL